VAALNRALLNTVHDAKGRHQLAWAMKGDFKLATRHVFDLSGKDL
jgi:hypothetical protein